VAELDGADGRRVNKAMDTFVRDPDHPSFNLHPIKGDTAGRLHSVRASDDLRILLAKEGNVYVSLEAGHHDAVYERARRTRFVPNANVDASAEAEVRQDDHWPFAQRDHVYRRDERRRGLVGDERREAMRSTRTLRVKQ